MDKITDILQQKTFNLAIKEIVKFAKKHTADRSVDIAIVEFFINFLGKSYELSEEDFEELDGTTDAYQHLAADIFESDDIEEISSEVPYSEFIKRIISELYLSDSLDHASLTCWVEILLAFIEHKDIAEEATIKAKSHILLTYMLYPMTELLNLTNDSNSMLEDDFKLAVEEAIERIMSNMEKSFKYEAFSVECAKHLKSAIINRHEAFIKDVSGMKIFTALLNYDDRTQLALSLTLLDDLCNIESLQDIVKEFFFPTADDTIDDQEERIIDKIYSLIHHKNLKSEVIGLIKSLVIIAENEEFLNEQKRYELFLNVFNKNKKIVMETCSLMTSMKVNFWMEMINMLNYYVTPEEINIPHILTSFKSTHEIEPKTFLEIACNNINDTPTSQRAAQMFLESIKLNHKVDEILPLLGDGLQTCVADAKTFCFIIECFNEMDHDELVDFFRDNVELLSSIIENIGQAFQAHSDRWVHKFCASVLFIFFKVSPEVTLQIVHGIMVHNLKIIIQAKEIDNDCIITLERMSALLEIKYWTILNENQLKKLFSFGKKGFALNDEALKSSKLYTVMIRLHTNVLKHLWVKIMKHNNVNFMTPQEMIADIKSFFALIIALSKDRNLMLDRQCIVFASILDMITMFQPTMKEKSNAEIFRKISLELLKDDMVHLIDTIGDIIFFEQDTEHLEFYKKLLMQAFVSFYLNNSKLPSLTAWEAFLRNYDTKTQYKTDLEQLMEHALKMEKGIFDKTVAFAMLNISNWNDLEAFREFYHAIESFVKIHQPDVKARNERFAVICSFVLEKLSKHFINTPNKNRLMILDCLTVIIKNLDTHYRKNLCSFIKFGANAKLSTTDRQKLEAFEAMLKE